MKVQPQPVHEVNCLIPGKFPCFGGKVSDNGPAALGKVCMAMAVAEVIKLTRKAQVLVTFHGGNY